MVSKRQLAGEPIRSAPSGRPSNQRSHGTSKPGKYHADHPFGIDKEGRRREQEQKEHNARVEASRQERLVKRKEKRNKL